MGRISTFMIATVLSVAAAAPAMSQKTEEEQKKYQEDYKNFWSKKEKLKNESIGEELSKPNLTQAEKERINSRVVLNGITYSMYQT